VTCALFQARGVESKVPDLVEQTGDLAWEVWSGSFICAGRPCDGNILADRKSGCNKTWGLVLGGGPSVTACFTGDRCIKKYHSQCTQEFIIFVVSNETGT